jgi:hypothetical protein
VGARVEELYSNNSTTTTDPTGVTRSTASDLTQRYRLSLDHRFYPSLRLSAAGNLDWLIGDTTQNGVSSRLDQKTWTGFATLGAGNETLAGSLNLDRQEQGSVTTSNGQVFRSPGAVRETYGAFANWRPEELPTLDLRYTRTNTYDQSRRLTDVSVDEAIASTTFSPSRALDLKYSLRYSNPVDHLNLVDTKEVDNAASIAWNDRFLEDRLLTSATYSIGSRTTRTSAQGTAGTVATQVFPIAGLFVVEGLVATPDLITLQPNDALVNSDTTASAGIDLGFGLSQSADVAGREMGLRFGNVDPVNALFLWVDRRLTPDVVNAFTFDVWRSDDNRTWTRVALSPLPSGGPAVQFGAILNRFEIGIATTRAQYLKVVTRPLSPGVTADPQFRSIFVTELQAFDVVAASAAARSTSQTSGSLTGSARYAILRGGPDLSYDISAFLAHSEGISRKTYSVANGLSFGQRLSRISTFSARLDRTDSGGTGLEHEALSRASALLSFDPLPTLGMALNYSAQLTERLNGTGYTNGAGAFVRADLYQGITVSANGSAALGTNEVGQSLRNASAAAALSLVPNRKLTLTGTYSYTTSKLSGGGRPEQTDTAGQVQGTMSFAPIPALYAAAGISRFVQGRPPATLVNISAGASPFPGGDLQLRIGYSETRDEGSNTTTRNYGPGLRWNIRSGAYLDAQYAWNDLLSPTLSTRSHGVVADLVIALR